MALGLVFSLSGAVALALVAEQRDRLLKTAEEVEQRLHMPVLLSIPRLVHGHALLL